MKERKLPSGSVLRFSDPPAPWAESEALYISVLTELKSVRINSQDDVPNLMKDLICTGFSSKIIKEALRPCLERVLYNGSKISESTFENVKAREDYMEICYAVIEENIRPFLKSLSVQFAPLLERLKISMMPLSSVKTPS